MAQTLTVPRSFGGTLITTYTLQVVAPTIYPPVPFPYKMNGTTLDSQPYLWTMPPLAGTVVPAGSLFTLLFANPSAATQTALTNGTQGTMTFLVNGGQPVSGTVQIASALSGITFDVTVTTLADIALNTRVIQTPFF